MKTGSDGVKRQNVVTLGKNRGPTRPARGHESQASGCLEPQTKGATVAGLVEVPPRERSPDPRLRCTRVMARHSPKSRTHPHSG